MAKVRIEVREQKKEGEHWIVRIDPFFDPEDKKRGFRPRVTVASTNQLDQMTDQGWTRKWTKADVSWPSGGGDVVGEISAFIESLRIAKEYVIKINEEHGVKE